MNLNFKIPNKFNMEFPSLPPIWTLQVRSPKKVELEPKKGHYRIVYDSKFFIIFAY